MATWNEFPEINRGDEITAEQIAAWLVAIKTQADSIARNYCGTNNSAVCESYHSSDNGTNKGVWTSNYSVKGK